MGRLPTPHPGGGRAPGFLSELYPTRGPGAGEENCFFKGLAARSGARQVDFVRLLQQQGLERWQRENLENVEKRLKRVSRSKALRPVWARHRDRAAPTLVAAISRLP